MQRFAKIVFVIMGVALFTVACSEMIPKKDHDIILTSGEFDESLMTSYNLNFSQLYRIMPGDVLELYFYFHESKEKEYVLMPRDIVAIKFPETSALNEEQRIRPDGRISLPYIGDVLVAGHSPAEVEKMLKEMFSSELKRPELYVVVREFGGAIKELKESIQNRERGQSILITVRNDGYVTLPIVGEVRAAGETVPDLSKIANKAYHRFTEDLQVNVLLHQATGSRICVLGEVRKPGYYQINQPMNIFQAVSSRWRLYG